MTDELNPDQEKAAKFKDGVCAVIAVPGSGKTRTMMERIGILVKDHGIPPEAILGLTFTRNAADEMRNRLVPVIGRTISKGLSGHNPLILFQSVKNGRGRFRDSDRKGPDQVHPRCHQAFEIQGSCHRDGLKGNLAGQKQPHNCWRISRPLYGR